MSAAKGEPVFLYGFAPVNFPVESYEVCYKFKTCGNYDPQILGDGLCIDCWDLKQYQFDRSRLSKKFDITKTSDKKTGD